ncbi:hypothetical protein TBLA_0I02510 [Henningerozyma blattae CBS 6284]|uniref:PH domain-containing protein n=1 Tax=Henningerozyma blattae (strain ATCC 34711 / CBS 6284 / DSM 70876 / NBRC 10599 / NRRL Y-10934 / UCD 77-7) TaxID=1071380 RepID=I2H957_HENB6|nr:hypothetical protein TBLA_0I02510 [Tetrapisispora blattae CBS 6284]CCH62909.1 hypothetical protein TBLA_0I02510 [Tetrapisispora blattae CBS 6284]
MSSAKEDVMESLLKEIDFEMEYTIGSLKSSKQIDSASDTKRFSIPLQDIGDETMEMLVSHNTKRNIVINNNTSVLQSPIRSHSRVTSISSTTSPIMVLSEIPILSPTKEKHRIPVEDPSVFSAATVSASSAYEEYSSDMTSPNEDELTKHNYNSTKEYYSSAKLDTNNINMTHNSNSFIIENPYSKKHLHQNSITVVPYGSEKQPSTNNMFPSPAASAHTTPSHTVSPPTASPPYKLDNTTIEDFVSATDHQSTIDSVPDISISSVNKNDTTELICDDTEKQLNYTLEKRITKDSNTLQSISHILHSTSIDKTSTTINSYNDDNNNDDDHNNNNNNNNMPNKAFQSDKSFETAELASHQNIEIRNNTISSNAESEDLSAELADNSGNSVDDDDEDGSNDLHLIQTQSDNESKHDFDKIIDDSIGQIDDHFKIPLTNNGGNLARDASLLSSVDDLEQSTNDIILGRGTKISSIHKSSSNSTSHSLANSLANINAASTTVSIQNIDTDIENDHDNSIIPDSLELHQTSEQHEDSPVSQDVAMMNDSQIFRHDDRESSTNIIELSAQQDSRSINIQYVHDNPKYNDVRSINNDYSPSPSPQYSPSPSPRFSTSATLQYSNVNNDIISSPMTKASTTIVPIINNKSSSIDMNSSLTTNSIDNFQNFEIASQDSTNIANNNNMAEQVSQNEDIISKESNLSGNSLNLINSTETFDNIQDTETEESDQSSETESNDIESKTNTLEHSLQPMPSVIAQSLTEQSEDQIEEQYFDTSSQIGDLVDDKIELPKKSASIIPTLPPLPKFDSLFVDDPFGDSIDYSRDSIDITKANKPSNYLSIWHMQDDISKAANFTTTSPAVSDNSQFSHRSISTCSTKSSASCVTNTSGNFRFRPRVVSRSRIYNPSYQPEISYGFDLDDMNDNNSSNTDFERRQIQKDYKRKITPIRVKTLQSKRISSTSSNRDNNAMEFPSIWKIADEENIEKKTNISNSTIMNYSIIKLNDLKEQEEADNVQDDLHAEINDDANDTIQKNSSYLVENLHSEIVTDEDINVVGEQSVQSKSKYIPETIGDSELLPTLPLVDDTAEFDALLGQLDDSSNSDKSFSSITTKNRQSSYNIWNEKSIQNTSIEKLPHVSNDVLNDLLDFNGSTTDDSINIEKSLNRANGHGSLKTPIKDVSIGQGLNINGFNAVEADEVSDEDISIVQEVFTHDTIPVIQVLDETPKEKTIHCSNPFKVTNNPISPKPEENSSDGCISKTSGLSLNEDYYAKSSQVDILPNEYVSKALVTSHSTEFNDLTVTTINKLPTPEQINPLSDKGNLYLTISNIKNFTLVGAQGRTASYAIEFDNGQNVIQTEWEPIPQNGIIEINKEFELVLEPGVKRFIITLKCRYNKQTHEMVEILDKIPISKKYPFSKQQYKFERRYTKRQTDHDEWEYLFAQDGSFARCEIELTNEFLNLVKFNNSEFNMEMNNNWARIPPKSRTSPPQDKVNIYDLPRRRPYKVADLKFAGCYLERTSKDERFPRSIKYAKTIVEKYRCQQRIFKTGYLLQEGGDVTANIQRKYFKLQGTSLVGYHEVTRTANIIINLLKVSKVLNSDDVAQEEGRNFTNTVLFGDCVQLVFEDGEAITLNTEGRQANGKNDWYDKLKEIVSLNICHQPWVKQFSEFSRMTDI